MDTILIVDDSEPNRELLRSLLEHEYRLLEAADGVTALQIVEQQDVDLVLLDVMMPGLTGYEVTRRMRELRRKELLPILLLTSLSDATERSQGFQSGADDFISKPVDAHELRLRVRAFLRARRLFRERDALLAEAQRLHAIKDDFVALLVHDLRNPLAGMMAFLEMLNLNEMTSDSRELLDGALGAARRLSQLTEDLLRAELLEKGALSAQCFPRNLPELARAAARSVAGIAASRGITVTIAPADETLTASCDAALVQRALENLLSNAIKYAPSSSRVSVGIKVEQDNVMLDVSDQGAGISVEQRPQMFSKFGTPNLHATGARRGHGLGLYFVGLAMQAHAGRVYVDEEATQGTRIVMTFPLQPALPS